MKIKRPYFMSKKEWYYFDNDASGAPNDPSLKLTELGASMMITLRIVMVMIA